MEKKEDEHFIHSQREISLPSAGYSLEIFKSNIFLLNMEIKQKMKIKSITSTALNSLLF